MIEPQMRERLEKVLKKAAENPEDEKFSPLVALDAILKEIEKNGFMQIIDLDPYFGEVSLPLKEQADLLIRRYPEAFSFFEAFMKDLQEEIELFFEVTEMYEDEEFDQFVEDMRIIKARYGEIFENEYKEKMNDFVKTVLDDLA
ncbi:hypothetical protein [Hydrogenimonas cancrithermarum]|uniref:Uncharacterized protein n=1 Tax=Hydrogenimonas cancrithermarum TaxID=2993563 RepID=A0ABM8FHU2_9BACT|nr:hypothetical protein [Hydrogenimonas cancrithermarum]BDY11846.1 hypothetical protein HCR_01580 [Hydrogenimonas cancrithermarum]